MWTNGCVPNWIPKDYPPLQLDVAALKKVAGCGMAEKVSTVCGQAFDGVGYTPIHAHIVPPWPFVSKSQWDRDKPTKLQFE